MVDRLPQESKAQEIGHKAQLALGAAQPLYWRLHSLEGTDDVGLDFQVQLVGEQRYRGIFRLQLKGTETPQRSASGEFLSISLKASTLNLYDRLTEPVLIVLSDLSWDSDPGKCPTYYVWAHDEIRRLKTEGRFEDDSETRTIRIPTANVLNRDLDVSRILEDNLRLHATANEFDQAVATAIPEFQPEQRAQILGGFTEEIPRRGRGFIESVSTPGSTPWPQAPKESVAGRLNAADQHLKHGDTGGAERILDELEVKISSAAPLERAEFWYLRGRSLALNSKEPEAAESYEKAHAAEPSVSKYLVAFVETQLRIRHIAGQPLDVSDLLEKLTSTKADVIGIAARVLAASGDLAGARAKLATLAPKEAINEKAIVATMQGDTAAVISICGEGLADPYLQENSRQLLLLLRARAHFGEALDLRADHGDFVIPAYGPSHIDLPKLHSAWADIEATVDLMRTAGWPTNIEHLADIWGTAAIILGRHDEVLNDVLEASRRRPGLPELQHCLERVATVCGRSDLALEAIERQPPGADRTFRKIAALHQAHHHGACVDLMRAEIGNLPRDHRMFRICLTIALLSADQVVREDAAQDFYAALSSDPAWADEVAVADYFRSIANSVLGRKEAVAKLADAYKRFNQSLNIAIPLFHALDANDSTQAQECISIAPALRARSQISLESTLHLAQAYTTVGDWASLLTLVNESITRFGPTGRLTAVKALALDKLGHTPEAMAELRGLVSRGVRDKLAINTYINIVTRCGFTREATDLVEALIGEESDRSLKLDYLRLLFALVHRSDPHGQRGENIAWRIGQIAKQDDEAEEGLFLIIYITATLSAKVKVIDERKNALQQRLARFTEKYPTSKILRAASLPENPSMRDLERMIVEVTGQKPERRAWQERMLLELERGTAPIPFAWRPRNILLNVSDIVSLWQIAKESKPDAKQYHLAMAVGGWQPADLKVMERHIPLFDLLTLFVVKDLELFETIFSLFPRIAVGQRTLLELQRLAQPMSGSWAQKQCVELIQKLQENFQHIVQPTIRGLKKFEEQQPYEEVTELAKSGKFMLYSDDALYRLFAEVPKEAPPAICTLDIFAAAEAKSLLTARQIAERISKLMRWHVDTVVAHRYAAAAIPESIGKATSVEGAVGALQSDPIASPLFEGMWNVRKPYAQLLADIGSILAFFVQEPRNRPETIAGVWGLWYINAKLRSEITINPPLRHAVLAMLKAAALLKDAKPEVFRLLWQSFLRLVPLQFGDRMDERTEREAIELAGRVAAQIELAIPEGAEAVPLKDRLLTGLTAGTAEQSWFLDSYTAASIQHALKKKQ
jgi:hypothetical protein